MIHPPYCPKKISLQIHPPYCPEVTHYSCIAPPLQIHPPYCPEVTHYSAIAPPPRTPRDMVIGGKDHLALVRGAKKWREQAILCGPRNMLSVGRGTEEQRMHDSSSRE